MAKSVPIPKNCVISCRVNDQELQILQDLADQCRSSISNLLRDALSLLAGEFSEPGQPDRCGVALAESRTRSVS